MLSPETCTSPPFLFPYLIFIPPFSCTKRGTFRSIPELGGWIPEASLPLHQVDEAADVAGTGGGEGGGTLYEGEMSLPLNVRSAGYKYVIGEVGVEGGPGLDGKGGRGGDAWVWETRLPQRMLPLTGVCV